MSCSRSSRQTCDRARKVQRMLAASGHRQLWSHVAAMVEIADIVEVFDNSGAGPRTVALFIAGDPVGQTRWPDWASAALVRLAH